LEARRAASRIARLVEQYEGDVVKRMSSERARTWIVDYSAARARAIEWLGDRYLLARPINSSENSWHKGLLHSQSSPVGPAERSR
jgi:hypothetical protein